MLYDAAIPMGNSRRPVQPQQIWSPAREGMKAHAVDLTGTMQTRIETLMSEVVVRLESDSAVHSGEGCEWIRIGDLTMTSTTKALPMCGGRRRYHDKLDTLTILQ